MNRIYACLSLIFLTAVVGQHVFCGPKKTDTTDTAETYPVYRNDTSAVGLKSGDMSDSKIVVYDSEPARVLVGYTRLMDVLKNFITQYNVPDDVILSDSLAAWASERDTIIFDESTGETGLLARLQFRLADMLEDGSAVVIDRKKGIAAKRILVEHFEVRMHKMAGRGGRRFYLEDGTLFLEIIDWIS